MLITRLLIALVSALCMTAQVSAVAQEVKPTEKNGESGSQPDWVVVEEDVWMRFNDEPSLYMQQAHESFLKKEYQTAAAETRKAAGYVHVAARNAAEAG